MPLAAWNWEENEIRSVGGYYEIKFYDMNDFDYSDSEEESQELKGKHIGDIRSIEDKTYITNLTIDEFEDYIHEGEDYAVALDRYIHEKLALVPPTRMELFNLYRELEGYNSYVVVDSVNGRTKTYTQGTMDRKDVKRYPKQIEIPFIYFGLIPEARSAFRGHPELGENRDKYIVVGNELRKFNTIEDLVVYDYEVIRFVFNSPSPFIVILNELEIMNIKNYRHYRHYSPIKQIELEEV